MAVRKIADEGEILKFYTGLLRGKFDDAKTAEAIKAAEFFVKYYGMLEKKGDGSNTVVIVDDISKVKEND